MKTNTQPLYILCPVTLQQLKLSQFGVKFDFCTAAHKTQTVVVFRIINIFTYHVHCHCNLSINYILIGYSLLTYCNAFARIQFKCGILTTQTMIFSVRLRPYLFNSIVNLWYSSRRLLEWMFCRLESWIYIKRHQTLVRLTPRLKKISVNSLIIRQIR